MNKQEEQVREELDWWNNVDLKLDTTNCDCCIHNARIIVKRMECLMEKLGIESENMKNKKEMFESVERRLEKKNDN